MPSIKTLLTSAALAYLANAKTIIITATNSNRFVPALIKAVLGDILEFHFEPGNHSVVAGAYDYPCTPLDPGSGFYSGFVSSEEGEADKVFRVLLNNTEPTPFYSSQADQCAKGMVGMVNPDSNRTLEGYRKRASQLAMGVTPGNATFGGKLIDSDDVDPDSDGKDGHSGHDVGDDNGRDDNDCSDECNDDNGDDGSNSDDIQGAAGFLHVPMLGLFVTAGVVFFMA